MGRLGRWLVGVGYLLLVVALVVGLTADGMAVVTARHTLLHVIVDRLPPMLQPPDPVLQPRGTVTGLVVDAQGQPVSGASVIVADWRGGAYRAQSGADGRYRIEDVPAGPYRPVAAAPGMGSVADAFALPTPWEPLGTLRWRPSVKVSGGTEVTADLTLLPRQRIGPASPATIALGEEETIDSAGAFPSRALRQTFALSTARRTTSGVIYAPETPGPHPAVLIVYPGFPETWEHVSVPLAARGLVIVAFTPGNFPDLDADVADLLFLTEALRDGRLTPHAAPDRQCVAAGSFSTIWMFLLLQQTDAYNCALSLGGISDAFLYYEDWTAGRIIPNPQFAPVPEMMAAMGWPNLAPDLFVRLSAVAHAETLPPMLVVHGTGDTIVPINQSVRLTERLRTLGRPVEHRIYSGMEHYLAASTADPDTVDLLETTVGFFHQYLEQATGQPSPPATAPG